MKQIKVIYDQDEVVNAVRDSFQGTNAFEDLNEDEAAIEIELWNDETKTWERVSATTTVRAVITGRMSVS